MQGDLTGEVAALARVVAPPKRLRQEVSLGPEGPGMDEDTFRVGSLHKGSRARAWPGRGEGQDQLLLYADAGRVLRNLRQSISRGEVGERPPVASKGEIEGLAGRGDELN